MVKSSSSESQSEREKAEDGSDKNTKIQHSLKSLKEQMKVTEEELEYRTENCKIDDFKEHSKLFKCTKCGSSFQSKVNKGAEISIHPILSVLMCTSCCNYYGNGEFSLDSEGEDKYCRWCGEGGTLFSCSKCICAFCKLCIKRHFSVSGLEKVKNDDDWVCYFCDPKPLWHLRSICSLAKEVSQRKKNELDSKLKEDKKRHVSKRRKGMNNSSSDINSSDLSKCESNSDSTARRKRKGRRATRSFYRCESSSPSDNEKENEEKSIRKRGQRGVTQTTKKANNSMVDREESENLRKKQLKEQQGSITAPEKSPLDENKLLVLDKFKGIWKLTQIISEIGLKWSNERLQVLSTADNFKNVRDLEKEYERLKSVIVMLSSAVTKACAYAESLKDDLNCANVKDERHVFQCEEANLKSLEQTLTDETTHKNLMNEKSQPKESEKEKPSNRSQSLFSAQESDSEDNRKATSESGENSSENQRPVLKVKEFAKMNNENIFNDQEEEKREEKDKSKPMNEYDVETEGSSDVEEVDVEKEAGGKSVQGDSPNKKGAYTDNTRSKKRQEDLQTKFGAFKEKREQYLKNVSQTQKNSPDSKEKEKLNFLESSDENGSEKKVRKSTRNRKKRKKIVLSDEEEPQQPAGTESPDSFTPSETSEGDSDTDSSLSKGPKKRKWKRIQKRKGNEESSESEEKEDDNKEGTEKKTKGRRNINKILKKDSLKLSTKEALKNEEERRKRIEERHKFLKTIFKTKETNKGEDSIEKDEGARELVLDFDPDTKEPIVQVHKKLVRKLKPHQVEGVRFMWDNCFESIKRSETEGGSGCILAHYMGLGKTLQVVTLVHTIMTNDIGVNTVLIICPLSIVNNWINEFESWLSDLNTEVIVLYEMTSCRTGESRCAQLREWHNTGGVMVMSYDIFRNFTNQKKATKPQKLNRIQKTYMETLLNPGPDLVVCDEGHLLKNEDTALSKCVNQIKTSRRIVLTGTPLQNNLREYHCMVQFVKPNILGTKKEFANRFINPITNGQFGDSTEHDVKIMKRRSHVLHSMLEGCVQRCDYSVLTPYLPEKQEYVLSISLTETQEKAYRYFIDNLSTRMTKGSKTATLFNDYHNLQRIWTHPRVMLMHKEKENHKNEHDSDRQRLKDFVVDSDEETPSTSDESDNQMSAEEIATTEKRVLRSNASALDPENTPKAPETDPVKDLKGEWWSEFFSDADYQNIQGSNKLMVLLFLLKRFGELGDKTLVFSQSLYSLDLIEHFLNKIDDHGSEGLAGFEDNWVHGLDYFRLDGTTSGDLRTSWCKTFNKKSNKRARLFLISTRAGGLGINLFSANRVIVFDASWNPSHDLQSIFRVYRFGQKKTCYVYRFLAEATMEEKIYERQVTKLSLAHRVVDELQIERHYSMMNLQELYTYAPTPKDMRKIPKLPKDTVLAELLFNYKDAVVSYHEHDSLLENKEEEELTEEERKAAWQEFEEEREQKEAIANLIALQNQWNAGLVQPEAHNSQYLALPFESQFPVPILERALKVGLRPLYGESIESFTTRVLNRELFMGIVARENEVESLESALWFDIIKRFVKYKHLSSSFSLGLLSATLYLALEKTRESLSPGSRRNVLFLDSSPEKPDSETETSQAGPSPKDVPAGQSRSEPCIQLKNPTPNQSTPPIDTPHADDSVIKSPEKDPEENCQLLNRNLTKKKFFSSGSDGNSDESDPSTDTTPEKVQRIGPDTSASTQKGVSTKGKKKEGVEKELIQLLQLAKRSVLSTTKSHVAQQRPQKKKGETDAKVTLLDFLNSRDSAENTDEVEEEGEEEALSLHGDDEVEGRFEGQVNSDVKTVFLMSSGADSEGRSSGDDEAEVIHREGAARNRGTKSKREGCGVSSGDEEDTSEEWRNSKSEERYASDCSSVVLSDSVHEETTLTESRRCNNREKSRERDSYQEISLSSESSDSDIQQIPVVKSNDSPLKGRRNINKIISNDLLGIGTKTARKLEAERKKRLGEREKTLQECLPSTGSSKLVLDFDAESKQELVVVDSRLSSKLKPHQREGVKFMWDSCFESLGRMEEDPGSGCILAHCMGLGKTLQVITLVHTILTHDIGINSVLILCPLNTIRNWLKEFKVWLAGCKGKVTTFEILSCKTKVAKVRKLTTWVNRGGVLVLSYELFRSMMNERNPWSKDFLPLLSDPGPDLVVCDEGHLLKNMKSALSKSISRIKTLRRIVLTGTPLQNNLIEYYCMVQFVKPNILGTMKEFHNGFVNPIKNGQFEDSTQKDVRIMKRRAHVLHTLLEGFVQRFGFYVLASFLPEKQEYVISVSLTETQDRLYRFFVDKCRTNEESTSRSPSLLKDFHWLQKVWTHPRVLLKASEKLRSYPETSTNPERWYENWEKFVQKEEYEDVTSSGKLVLLFNIIRICQKIGDKILVFSQHLSSLNLIEHFLKGDECHKRETDDSSSLGSWLLNQDYFRIDGSTTTQKRFQYCRDFNDPNKPRPRLMLISTKAGGMGINLVGANRAVVFDVSWNPSHDLQSIFRVYRFGQNKPCFIYRFLAEATMEEKIYKRQVTKLSLALRIVDEHQIERHYSMTNLHELYNYDPTPKNQWKVPNVPKDSLFAEILSSNRDIIVNYHEHDSLLENKQEEELTEEERQAAWEDFEKDRFTEGQTPPDRPNPDLDPQTHFAFTNQQALNAVVDYKKALMATQQPTTHDGYSTTSHSNLIINAQKNDVCRIADVRTLNVETAEGGRQETTRNSVIKVNQLIAYENHNYCVKYAPPHPYSASLAYPNFNPRYTPRK